MEQIGTDKQNVGVPKRAPFFQVASDVVPEAMIKIGLGRLRPQTTAFAGFIRVRIGRGMGN
jgi:hypothetical protein